MKGSLLNDNEKRWFINQNGNIRYALSFIRTDIKYNYKTCHLVVSMPNTSNAPYLGKDESGGCILEEANIKDFFISQKEAQIEILIRERFNKKP